MEERYREIAEKVSAFLGKEFPSLDGDQADHLLTELTGEIFETEKLV